MLKKVTESKKEDFKHKLAGSEIDWKALAMYQCHLLCEAEIREKEFIWESRYFYEKDKEMLEGLDLTEKQIERICDEYIEWLEVKDKNAKK